MAQTNPLKIFLVDDDPFYLNILEQCVRISGYSNLSCFQDGHSCLNQLHERPDVIFLDYSMGEMTGYEVLQKIKRFDPNIYVVIISGQDQIGPAVDSLKHGAFDYIQKGNNEDEKIKKVLELSLIHI